jgi:hypothetical protein
MTRVGWKRPGNRGPLLRHHWHSRRHSRRHPRRRAPQARLGTAPPNAGTARDSERTRPLTVVRPVKTVPLGVAGGMFEDMDRAKDAGRGFPLLRHSDIGSGGGQHAPAARGRIGKRRAGVQRNRSWASMCKMPEGWHPGTHGAAAASPRPSMGANCPERRASQSWRRARPSSSRRAAGWRPAGCWWRRGGGGNGCARRGGGGGGGGAWRRTSARP